MLILTHTTLASIAHTAWLGLSASEVRSLAILLVFALLFALEALGGCRNNPPKQSRQSYLTNLGTFLMNDTLMSLMSVSALLLVAENYGHWGLLHGMKNPVLKEVLTFLGLDLTLYLWHRLNHSHDSLWMFHKVHHSDPSMNVSTAFRLHFVEVVLTAMVKAGFIMLMGVDSTVVLANEALITLMVMFHHANIRFSGEHWLAKLIVVPYLHRVHHSTLRKEHDNNYGAVFSFWDRLFGSFAETEPKKIGIESVPGLGILELVRYGLSPSWLPQSKPIAANSQTIEKMIAEAAYYRSKARGFAPGYDYSDWLEAEKEITHRFGKDKKRRANFSFFCCSR